MNLKVLTIITASIMLLSANVLNAQNKTDDKGRKQGHWVKTAKNGKKISEGNFKDDYPVDTFYYYDSKGKVSYKISLLIRVKIVILFYCIPMV